MENTYKFNSYVADFKRIIEENPGSDAIYVQGGGNTSVLLVPVTGQNPQMVIRHLKEFAIFWTESHGEGNILVRDVDPCFCQVASCGNANFIPLDPDDFPDEEFVALPIGWAAIVLVVKGGPIQEFIEAVRNRLIVPLFTVTTWQAAG